MNDINSDLNQVIIAAVQTKITAEVEVPAGGYKDAEPALDWEHFGIYAERALPTDWVHVATVGEDGGYDWVTLHAFWSPTARRYFWASGTGCSCSSWGDDLDSECDFESGDKRALQQAIRAFTEANRYAIDPITALDAVAEVARFKEFRR